MVGLAPAGSSARLIDVGLDEGGVERVHGGVGDGCEAGVRGVGLLNHEQLDLHDLEVAHAVVAVRLAQIRVAAVERVASQ